MSRPSRAVWGELCLGPAPPSPVSESPPFSSSRRLQAGTPTVKTETRAVDPTEIGDVFGEVDVETE